MEDNGTTSLESLFNGTAATSDPEPAEITPEPEPQEPAPTGEPTATPPVEEPDDPKVAAFKAKAIDEGKKRQKLEQEYAEAQRQIAEYQRHMQQLQQAQQQQRQQAQPAAQGLQPQNFPTYEAFLEAVAEQKAEAKAQEIFERNMQRQAQMQQQAALQRQAADDLQDMFKAGRERFNDFDQVVGNPSVPISEIMMTTMMALDGGHGVAYSLAMNPAEAARIARMPPSSQAREIGKLAKQFVAAAAPVVAPPPVVPELPKTLTQTRSAGGQFTKAWTGPTPLDAVVRRK